MSKTRTLNRCITWSFLGFAVSVSVPVSFFTRLIEDWVSLPENMRNCETFFNQFLMNYKVFLVMIGTLLILTMIPLYCYTRGVVKRVEGGIVNLGSKSYIIESAKKAETEFQSQWSNERLERLNVLESAKKVNSAYLHGCLSKEIAKIFCEHTFNYSVLHLPVEATYAYKLTYYFRRNFEEPFFDLIDCASPLAQEIKPRVFEEVDDAHLADKIGLLSYFLTRKLTSECYDKDGSEWKKYFKRFSDDTFDNWYESMYLYKLKNHDKVMIVFCLDCTAHDGMTDPFLIGKMEEAMRMILLERG